MTDQAKASTGGEPQFAIHRVYLKDASFETPNSPAVFTQEWKPEVSLQLNSSVNPLESQVYEVVLNVTVTAQQGDKTAFLAEIQQAGIFTLRGFDEQQMGSMLGAFCPNTLFPFAREAISDLVVKGGFPQLLLAPINFDALYAQKLRQESPASSPAPQSAH
ncbi:MAG: protein-export chaperone SecB [Gammaproteobacteria bacterium]|jgi:preprotein translocase subunit SecB